MQLSALINALRERDLDIEFDVKSDFIVDGILPLDMAGERSISYVELDKYIKDLENTKAGAVIVRKELKDKVKRNAIISSNPNLAMAIISGFFEKPLFGGEVSSIASKSKNTKISASCKIMPGAFVGECVGVGENSIIMPGVVICDNVQIGKNCIIYPNVVVYSNTQIGNNVRIQAGAVIGSDGYGYEHDKMGTHTKIVHQGGVIIDDNVEIGANTAIDRGVFNNTIIKSGTKIDNLVHIAHNCVIGENTLITAQVGISGSTKLGRNVVVGGQAGFVGHIEVGDFVQVAAKSGITKNLEKGKKYRGNPALELREYESFQARLRQIAKKRR